MIDSPTPFDDPPQPGLLHWDGNPRVSIAREADACVLGMREAAKGGDPEVFLILMERARRLGWAPERASGGEPPRILMCAASLGPAVLHRMAETFPCFFGSLTTSDTEVVANRILMSGSIHPGIFKCLSDETGWTPSHHSLQSAAIISVNILSEMLSVPGAERSLHRAAIAASEGFLGTSRASNPAAPTERSFIPQSIPRLIRALGGSSPALEARILSNCLCARPGASSIDLISSMSLAGIAASASICQSTRLPSAKDPDTMEALAKILLERTSPTTPFEIACRLADYHSLGAMLDRGSFQPPRIRIPIGSAGIFTPFFEPAGRTVPSGAPGDDPITLLHFTMDPFLLALVGAVAHGTSDDDLGAFASLCVERGISDTEKALRVFENIIHHAGTMGMRFDRSRIWAIRSMVEDSILSNLGHHGTRDGESGSV